MVSERMSTERVGTRYIDKNISMRVYIFLLLAELSYMFANLWCRFHYLTNKRNSPRRMAGAIVSSNLCET